MAVETAALEESAGDKEKAILGKGKGCPIADFRAKDEHGLLTLQSQG